MKKNSKGYFLAESVVVITLITIIMVSVYPNIASLYENYKYQAKIYDQTEDIYTLKAVDSILSKYDYYGSTTNNGCNNLINNYNVINDDIKSIFNMDDNNVKVSQIYLTNYMTTRFSGGSGDIDADLNRYISRLKKKNNDPSSYRLVGIFQDEDLIRYASIKVNTKLYNYNCNNGGE